MASALLLESGDKLLLESGDVLLLEQDGDALALSGERRIVDGTQVRTVTEVAA